MKKNLRVFLAVLLALTLIVSAVAALAGGVTCPHCGSENVSQLTGIYYQCLNPGCSKSFSNDSGSSPNPGNPGGNDPGSGGTTGITPGSSSISPSSGSSSSSSSSSSAGAAKGYISIPGSVGEIKFVSTRKCYIFKDGYKEYFDFRVEDGKLILTNADGEQTEVTVGEDGKGALEIALGNGDIFTAEFNRTMLNYIVNNGVFPIEKEEGGNG